ncbi:hypothetical protein MKW92_015748 [Papaver armeniacum]|nr:hypothetical protein MKW92_015748 [Papaver armeniacum]
MGEEVETASPEIIIPGEWTQAAESIAHDHSLPSPLIALICGPKNSGKTTFSPYLDTDVGQPELTPPGCLALTIIEKSNFFGDTSSKRDPRTYLNNVFSLYNYFREEAKPEVPLVINTPEWVKGNGYDALVEMLKCIACSPTHMVQVGISTESKNQELSVCLIEIASARRDDYNRSQCFPSDFSVDTFKELAQALTAHHPYVVPILRIKIKHLHCQLCTFHLLYNNIGVNSFYVPSREIFYALNVSIVGLAVSSAKSSDSEYGTPWCVVLGIVRGIDVPKGIFNVLTPVPLSNLEKVDLFLQGFLSLLYLTGVYMSTNVLLQSRDLQQVCEIIFLCKVIIFLCKVHLFELGCFFILGYRSVGHKRNWEEICYGETPDGEG